jgi:hypothetical protein
VLERIVGAHVEEPLPDLWLRVPTHESIFSRNERFVSWRQRYVVRNASPLNAVTRRVAPATETRLRSRATQPVVVRMSRFTPRLSQQVSVGSAWCLGAADLVMRSGRGAKTPAAFRPKSLRRRAFRRGQTSGLVVASRTVD